MTSAERVPSGAARRTARITQPEPEPNKNANSQPIDDKTLDAPLFPPINQWGHLPFPIEPLSPHSTSRLARQADTGLAHHRVLDVDEVITPPGADQAATGPAPAVPGPVCDWEAANQRKRDAVQQLAPLSDALDDIENRIQELMARTSRLELG